MTNQKWMPITAGILDILNGIIMSLAGFAAIFSVYFERSLSRTSFLGIILPFLLILGLLPIIGGVCSMKRKGWHIALTGTFFSLGFSLYISLNALMSSPGGYYDLYQFLIYISHPIYISNPVIFLWIPSTIAIVFTVLSREQFSKEYKMNLDNAKKLALTSMVLGIAALVATGISLMPFYSLRGGNKGIFIILFTDVVISVYAVITGSISVYKFKKHGIINKTALAGLISGGLVILVFTVTGIIWNYYPPYFIL